MEHPSLLYTVVMAVGLLLLALLLLVRGDDGDDGRSPEPGAPAAHVVVG